MKRSYDVMPREDKQKIMRIMAPGSTGRVDRAPRTEAINSAIEMIHSITWSRETRSSVSRIQCDKLEFISHWSTVRGRTRQQAKDMWKVEKKGPHAETIQVLGGTSGDH